MLMKCPVPPKPTPGCTAWAPSSSHWHKDVPVAVVCTPQPGTQGDPAHITHLKPQLCWSHKPSRARVSDLDFLLSLHCMERAAGLQWALDMLGSVCWGEAARGVSVPTHSADHKAKAAPARSCGYLLWHKIQITLFVLEREQNLTL